MNRHTFKDAIASKRTALANDVEDDDDDDAGVGSDIEVIDGEESYANEKVKTI
jgi:hypothetical protein